MACTSKFNQSEQNWRNNFPTINEKLVHVLQHGNFSDVSFCVGSNLTGSASKIIKAHKFILMLASPVFEAMFTNGFKEGNLMLDKPITVPDIEPLVFKKMIKYLYVGELSCKLSVETLTGLMYASKKYEITNLTSACSDLLRKKMSVDDAVSVYQAAILLDMTDLISDAKLFIQRNFDKLLDREDFQNFSLGNLSHFLDDAHTSITDELELFKAILSWSTADCCRKDLTVTPTNQRKVLGNCLNLIRFTSIPMQELALQVVPTGILSDKEITLLFQHMVVSSTKTLLLPPLPFSTNRVETNQKCFEFSFLDCEMSTELKDLSTGVHYFTFQVDNPVKFVGIGFLSQPLSDSVYQINMKLQGDFEQDLGWEKNKCFVEKDSTFYVDFMTPVWIQPHKQYTLCVVICGGNMPALVPEDVEVEVQTIKFTVVHSTLKEPLKQRGVVFPKVKFQIT